jgi:hypothetical protein
MSQKIELTGHTFGRLIVLKEDEEAKSHTRWICKCTCGVKKSIRGDKLRNNFTKSCGCFMKEAQKDPSKRNPKTHGEGHLNHGEYKTWLGMRERCYCKTNHAYNNYGGRGIKICDRWLAIEGKGYINFLEDMGRKPNKSFSLDRINNDGNYEPTNCRWATPKQQANNKKHGNQYIRNYSA